MQYISQILLALSTFLLAIHQIIMDNKKNKKPTVASKIIKQNTIAIDIKNRLENAKDIFNADRIGIHEFHNGSYNANGISMMKVDMTYEATKYGVKSVQKHLNNIPFSISACFVDKLIKNNIVKIKNVDEIPDTCASFRQIEKSNGVKALTGKILLNNKNEPIGFITINWNKREDYTENDRELYRLASFIEEKISK